MIDAHPMATRMLAGLTLSALCGCALAAQDTSLEQRVLRIENGLLPAGATKDNLGVKAGIRERMRAYGIPGLSIAVIDGGKIAWTKAFGEIEAGSGRLVTPTTLFQAGSISKPVAALGALSLVQQQKLSLDSDVNASLVTWKIPSNEFTAKNPVTLRMLLSHSAGLTVHGFGGYEVGQPIPSLTQILNGEPPANSGAIRVNLQPGERLRYSGGGYTVMQQLLIDVSGKPFETFMASAVLEPLEMRDSTYVQRLTPPQSAQLATGHYAGGQAVRGGHHLYPEMAAAGLWTTATDLAKFALHVQAAHAGTQRNVISQRLAREMLTLQKGDAGLGLFLSGAAGAARFGHDGVDEGFEAMLIAYVERGQGAVVMANGNFARPLVTEILESVAREYEWPAYPQTKQQEIIAMPRSVIAAAVGTYARDDGDTLEVFAKGERLFGRVPGIGEIEIFATDQDRYFVAQFGGSFIRFDREGDAPITAIRMGVASNVQFKRVK